MDAAQAKRITLMASVGAGVITGVGQVAKEHGWPTLRVVVATFGFATITTAVAEVAPKVAATAALTVLATSLFAISDAPAVALSNLAAPRDPVAPGAVKARAGGAVGTAGPTTSTGVGSAVAHANLPYAF